MAQWTGKRWCFTINAKKNSDEDEAFWELAEYWEAMNEIDVAYLICKGEQGEMGNYHLQGYVTFKCPMKMKEIKALFGCPHMHLEKCKGDEDDNIAYVSKVETAWNMFQLKVRDHRPKKAWCDETNNPWREEHWKKCDKCKEYVIRETEDFLEKIV